MAISAFIGRQTLHAAVIVGVLPALSSLLPAQASLLPPASRAQLIHTSDFQPSRAIPYVITPERRAIHNHTQILMNVQEMLMVVTPVVAVLTQRAPSNVHVMVSWGSSWEVTRGNVLVSAAGFLLHYFLLCAPPACNNQLLNTPV